MQPSGLEGKRTKWIGKARPLYVALLALGLVVAACADGTNGEPAVDAPQEADDEVRETAEQPSGDPIRIGGIFDLTGPAAALGTSSRDGALLAVEEINNDGGILGRPVDLQVEDGACDAARGTAAARKLVDDDDTFMLFGVSCSPVALAIRDFASAEQVPLLVTTATADEITQPVDRYVFQSNVPASVEARALTRAVLERFDEPNIAVVYVGTEYGRASADGVQEALESEGRSDLFAGEVEVPVAASDYRPQALQLQQLDADVTLLVVLATPPFVQQAADAGVETTWVTFSGGAMRSTVMPMAEDGTLPGLMTSYYSPTLMSTESGSDGLASFTQAFFDRYGEFPDTTNLQGYYAMHLVSRTLESAGEVDRESFVEALAGLGEVDMDLTFPLEFSSERHAGASGIAILEYGETAPGDDSLYGDASLFVPEGE